MLSSSSARGSPNSIAEVITNMVNNKQWEEALHVLEDNFNTLDQDAYVAGMYACSKNGMWQTALSLVDEMRKRNMEPSITAWNYILNSCSLRNNWEKCVEMLLTVLMKDTKARRLSPERQFRSRKQRLTVSSSQIQ